MSCAPEDPGVGGGPRAEGWIRATAALSRQRCLLGDSVRPREIGECVPPNARRRERALLAASSNPSRGLGPKPWALSSMFVRDAALRCLRLLAGPPSHSEED